VDEVARHRGGHNRDWFHIRWPFAVLEVTRQRATIRSPIGHVEYSRESVERVSWRKAWPRRGVRFEATSVNGTRFDGFIPANRPALIHDLRRLGWPVEDLWTVPRSE
jgi:hypothetical protein